MHSTQRQKLRWTMPPEPINALGVILKCSVCLAVLILLAVIGSADEKTANVQAVHAVAPSGASAASTATAAAHRKEIFDGRRAHYLGGVSERGFADRDLSKRADVVVP